MKRVLGLHMPPGREGGTGGRVDQAWTPLVVCWSRLLLAPESPLWIPLPNSTFSCAILLAKLAMVGVLSTKGKKKKHTHKTAQCCTVGLPSPSRELAVRRLPAHHCVHGPGLILPPRGSESFTVRWRMDSGGLGSTGHKKASRKLRGPRFWSLDASVVLVTQSWPILCDHMDCSLPGSSVHGTLSRQEHWSGLPCPSPEGVPDPGIELGSPALQPDFFTIWATREALGCQTLL